MMNLPQKHFIKSMPESQQTENKPFNYSC